MSLLYYHGFISKSITEVNKLERKEDGATEKKHETELGNEITE